MREKDLPIPKEKKSRLVVSCSIEIAATCKLRNSWSFKTKATVLQILTPSASSDESEIIELGDLVLHHRGAVPELAATVLVVPGLDGDQGAVGDLVERDDLEGHGQRLVRPPVRRQRAAEDGGASGSHEIPVAGLQRLVNRVEAVHSQRSFRQMHFFRKQSSIQERRRSPTKVILSSTETVYPRNTSIVRSLCIRYEHRVSLITYF